MIEQRTTQQINDVIIAQLEASLNQTIPLLPKSFLRVLAKALAGVFVLLYKYAGFIYLQQFVATAFFGDTTVNGTKVNPLVFWGRLRGVTDPVPATLAELDIAITVTAQGGSIPAGAQLVSSANGITYLIKTGVTLDSDTVTATVTATESGAIGNLSVNDSLSFANPLGNVLRETTVTAVNVTAADAESESAYRQRVIDQFQKQPQGGAYADYEKWAEEVAGIINAYPYTGDPGQVNVYTEATPISSNADGIPTAAQIQAVFDNIEIQRPAGAFVNSLPITRVGFDVKVLGIINVTDLAKVKADIETALAEYFKAAEPYIVGLSLPPRRDTITKTSVSAIVEDIVTAANGTFTGVQLDETGNDIGIDFYILGEGEKSKIVDVSYAA